MGRAPSLRFANLLSPRLDGVYRSTAEAVARRLGTTATMRTVGDPVVLEGGGWDLAFLCSPPYLWLADRPTPLARALVAPILCGERYGGRPVYFSDVIVAAGSDAATFADLRGRTFAINEPWSWSGCGVVGHHLCEIEAVDGFFGEVITTGFHQRSIHAVASGVADAAAIDSQVLAIELRERPSLERRVRVIARLGPSPIQPVAVSTAYPSDRVEDLRDAFGGAHLEPRLADALAFGGIERWAPVEEGTYDPVRRRLRELVERGPRGFAPPDLPRSGTAGP